MAKKLMKTAKELAWKAYHDAYKDTLYKTMNEIEIKERFENWWSENYGNITDEKKYSNGRKNYIPCNS